MRVSLPSKAGRILLIAVCVLVGLAYITPAVLDTLVAYFVGRGSPRALRAAVWLRPDSAENHYLLGRYLWLVEQAPEEASRAYSEAVALNPNAARYWLELAATYQWLGKDDAEMDAVNRAVAAEPTSPSVAWDAANYYLIHGDIDRALQEYREVLGYDPFLYPAAVQAVWRVKPDPDYLLQNVIPAVPDIYTAFLNLMLTKSETSAAAKVWGRIEQLRQPVASRYVFAYVAYLVDHQEPDQASQVWHEAGLLSGRSGHQPSAENHTVNGAPGQDVDLSAYQPSAENLIVNGDFSKDVLNGGFDWSYVKHTDVDLSLDRTNFQSGPRSLLIDFSSHGLKDAGVWHFIAVQPNTGYKFSAYYKSDGIAGVGGPRFVIQDQYTHETYFSSDYLTDEDYFRQVGGEFISGPDSRLLVLRVQREPFGSPIKGKLWIDGIRLVQNSK